MSIASGNGMISEPRCSKTVFTIVTILLGLAFGALGSFEDAHAQAAGSEFTRDIDWNGKRMVLTCRRARSSWIPGTGRKKRFTAFTYQISAQRKLLVAAKKISNAKKRKKAIGKINANIKNLRDLLAYTLPICAAGGENPGNGPNPTPPGGGPSSPLPLELSFDKLARPFTADDVRWFMTRAGYGINPRRHQVLFDLAAQGGIDAVVDRMLTVQPEVAGLEARVFELLDNNLNEGTTRFNNYTLDGMRRAAITWAVNTSNPVLHRLGMETFYGKWTVNERVFPLQAQYEIFWEYRKKLLEFAMDPNVTMKDLLVNISEDPAMLIFLDNASNTQGVPNENYAREIQELYSMGTWRWSDDCSARIPNYREEFDGIRQFGDIFQATLALSGYGVFPRTIDGRVYYRAVFSEADHRPGPKVVYRGTGHEKTIFKMRDLVDAIIAHPGAAQGLATDLLKAYVTPEPSCLMVTEFAKIIRAQNFNLRAAVTTLFKSNLFYNRQFANTVLKSPLQRVAQFANAMGLTFTDADLVDRPAATLRQEIGINTGSLNGSLEMQGMIINSPPTVFYYDQRAWTSSLTLAEHTNELYDMVSDFSVISRLVGSTEGTGNNTKYLFLDWWRQPGDRVATDFIRFAAERLYVQLTEDQVNQLAFYIQNTPNQQNPAKYDRYAWDNQTYNPNSFPGTRLLQAYVVIAGHPKYHFQ